MKNQAQDLLHQNKVFLWLAMVTASVLLIPLLGRWPWTIGDFLVMGLLIFGFGSVFILISRIFPQPKHRVIIGLLVLFAFLWIWAELAVGIMTNWGS